MPGPVIDPAQTGPAVPSEYLADEHPADQPSWWKRGETWFLLAIGGLVYVLLRRRD